ncbi:MAG: MBL fold metallo-hydrolase [Acidobacteria bacterium]|nr:MBL fold metallo-hydrolase [Acidobacteriota bacterium]
MLSFFLAAQIVVTPGPINRVSVNGAVLLPAAMRDLLPSQPIVVPEADRKLIEEPEKFWSLFRQTRFHDYAQRSTRVPIAPPSVYRFVKAGDSFGGVTVLATPGPTDSSVSYEFQHEGKRYIAVGALIHSGGRLLDIYSLQDAISETKTRGYHGFASRAGKLIESLRAVKARNADVLIPSRGPFIANPSKDIDGLIARMESLLDSHFATDALRWYWGPESWRTRGQLTMTRPPSEPMPMAPEKDLPPWIIAIGNSRLIVSTSGAAFLLDAGYPQIVEKLEELQQEGRFRNLEGLWITHYHDDHTDHASKVAKRFQAKVYFNESIRDIVEHPSHYRMPCLTTNPIRGDAKREREKWSWREFQLTSYFFPGQTLYHGGLGVEREDGTKLLFAGDSFTPAGTDDYCLQNRNLVHAGQGYLYCLDLIEQLGSGYWLINQHVAPMFHFDAARIARMREELRKREHILTTLTPFPDANYAVDEGWARIYPYSAKSAGAAEVDLELRLENHTAARMEFEVRWNVPSGWTLVRGDAKAQAGARATAIARARLRPNGPAEVSVVTADVDFDGLKLPAWTEAILEWNAR